MGRRERGGAYRGRGVLRGSGCRGGEESGVGIVLIGEEGGVGGEREKYSRQGREGKYT